MLQPPENLDITNVDYNDVLHLYKGWKKAESALKEKTKELQSFKSRTNVLQEAHLQFKSQIKALEGVKELTVDLQQTIMRLEGNSKQLQVENRELAGLNLQAEHLLKEKVLIEQQQNKRLQDVQINFATLTGKYDESLKMQKNLERQCADEQVIKKAAESRCLALEDHIEKQSRENKSLQQKLDTTLMKLNQCDYELQHASEQLSSLSNEVVNFNNTKNQIASYEAEIGILKGDISRLLRLLEFSPANQEFYEQWMDSDGMVFVGTKHANSDPTDTLGHSHEPYQSLLNPTTDLTPAEFKHLKRIHGGDPFPMSSNMAEESEYWVPNEAAKLGLDFLAERMPHASPKVIMDFLRSMNKVWLRRERRKIKRVKEMYNTALGEMKRRLSHSKPYKGVLAERQIRRLKSQVKEERTKSLTGRARGALEEDYRGDEFGVFEAEDQLDFSGDDSEEPWGQSGSRSGSRSHINRPCKVAQYAKDHPSAGVSAVTSKQLLATSLQSLESMSRRMSQSSRGRGGWAGGGSGSGSSGGSGGPGHEPSENYLRGAMWLGRNLSMIAEDLSEGCEGYRTTFLAEVSAASQDVNARRSSHRLTLLSGSCIAELVGMVNKSRTHAREILQGLAAIQPGDSVKFQRYLSQLPIESTLLSKSGKDNSKAGRKGQGHNIVVPTVAWGREQKAKEKAMAKEKDDSTVASRARNRTMHQSDLYM